MVSKVRRYEITDEEWEYIKPYIPEEQEAGSRGRPSRDSRQMLNGIFWILRSGASWRDLPERYGPWQTVYKRFMKWSKAGIVAEKENRKLSPFLDSHTTAPIAGTVSSE